MQASEQPKPEVVKSEPRVEVEKPKPTVSATTEDKTRPVAERQTFNQALGVMSEGAVGIPDILDEMQNNTLRATFKGTSFVLSAGLLTWALRGVSLLASVAATLPAWQGFDPLPMLSAKMKKDDKPSEEEEAKEFDLQEKRVEQLFNPLDADHG